MFPPSPVGERERESLPPKKKEKKGEGWIYLSPRPSIGVHEREKVEIYNFNIGID